MFLKLEELTVEQKIGMVLCARRFHPEDVVFTKELIKKRAVGCIQFHAKDREIIEDVMSVADYPIIVVNDTENGFPTSDLPKVPLISLAACGKKEYYEAYAKGIVRDAKKAGFNATWGPVVDILHMDEPCSVSRKFSNIPEKVAVSAPAGDMDAYEALEKLFSLYERGILTEEEYTQKKEKRIQILFLILVLLTVKQPETLLNL